MADRFEGVTRFRHLRGILVAGLAFGFAGAFPAAAQPREDVVFASPVLSQHFDPTTMVSTADYLVSDMLYDGLINLGPDGKFPGLAESWTISADGKSIDFILRKGVKFHNGDPLTAEDVKFTFEKIIAPGSTHSYRRGFMDSLERVDVVNEGVARFILKAPWPAFFTTSRNALTHIVPKKYYEAVGPKGFQEKPVGTGPFKFAGMKSGEWTRFEANEAYWAGAPKVKTAIQKLVAEPFTRYAMLERGEADIASGLTGPLLERARGNKSFRIVMSRYSGTSGILFNKEKFPEAQDRRVRLAVAHAIDRKSIAEKLLGGVCEPGTGIFTPGTFGYLDGLPQIPYDPARAKALLAEAGVKPNHPVTFTLHTQSFAALPGGPQVLEAIAGSLEAVGLKVERVGVDTDAWMSMMRGGKQPGIFYAPSGTPDDGGELINTWFVSTSAWTAKSIKNPDYDRIFAEQLKNSDSASRQKQIQEFARLEHERLEMVPLLWCDTPLVVGPRVKSWRPALSSGYYLNLDELELNR